MNLDLNMIGCPENVRPIHVTFHLWEVQYLEIFASHFAPVLLAEKIRFEVIPHLWVWVTLLVAQGEVIVHWSVHLMLVWLLHLHHHPEMVGLHWGACSHLERRHIRGEQNKLNTLL